MPHTKWKAFPASSLLSCNPRELFPARSSQNSNMTPQVNRCTWELVTEQPSFESKTSPIKNISSRKSHIILQSDFSQLAPIMPLGRLKFQRAQTFRASYVLIQCTGTLINLRSCLAAIAAALKQFSNLALKDLQRVSQLTPRVSQPSENPQPPAAFASWNVASDHSFSHPGTQKLLTAFCKKEHA